MEGNISAQGLLDRSAKFFEKNHWKKREGQLSHVQLRMLIKQELEEEEKKKHPKKKKAEASKSRQLLKGIYDRNLQILTLSEGSIGAMTFLKELEILERPTIDQYLRAIDDMGVYEEDLYTLWDYCCLRKTKEAGLIIRLYMAGLVEEKEIHSWILNRDMLDPIAIKREKEKQLEEMES